MNSLCNGIKDCEDNSDEKFCDSEGRVRLPYERVERPAVVVVVSK